MTANDTSGNDDKERHEVVPLLYSRPIHGKNLSIDWQFGDTEVDSHKCNSGDDVLTLKHPL